ncbi:sensor domain-containing diguanylate cyclase [Methylomarinum sp. Ch1-1]|uniref:diguanylate cyclase n=1 Tax=Methylomarinum roseum TaxID=3067653 RepID=A0AAU7NRE1_9GAMM|nr:sensor domain-containing diguanylate cyclase [Methylomarinum sp. Ch1-1]MDP4520505.1 sensor domain-containing diguanylate cyclase [Methylomarinum sp. Ch1-1]
MPENINYEIGVEHGMEDIVVDLMNSLSTIKELSELNYQLSVNDEKLLLDKALSTLIQNQDMERCSFFLLNEDEQVLVNVTGLSYFEVLEDLNESFQSRQFKVGEGIIGLAAEKKTLQHCHNCREDERFINNGAEMDGAMPGSIISVPVFAANLELIGVLNISHPEPYYFTEWHIRLLEIYKNMLGQLISNYRLFHQMERQIASRTTKLERAYKDIKRLKEHYENISVLDQLTGLYNRRYFYNQIKMTMAGYERYGQAMCLLIMDIDHFKSINDNYGHIFGDQVLIDIANLLKTQVRHADVLVRFGGEEFVIIFTNTSCANGIMFAERIRKEVNQLFWQKKDDSIRVTMSIGLYCHDNDCCQSMPRANIDQIIHYADMALYAAKKRGRNQVVKFSKELIEE